MEFPNFNDRSYLPFPGRVFVGRSQELDHLTTAFLQGARAAVIVGPAASGKTEIAREYILRNRKRFPGGVAWEYAYHPSVFETLGSPRPFGALPSEDFMLVVNDAELLDEGGVRALWEMSKINKHLHLILTSRTHIVLDTYFGPQNAISIHVGALPHNEVAELALLEDFPLSSEQFRRLCAVSQGNPLVIDVARQWVQDRGLPWDEVFARLSDFVQPGILGPDGQPLLRGSSDEKQIICSVTEVNDELLRVLRKSPDLLLTLAPRKFEEIVAEILSRLGYKVTLTPASGDGGIDVFAAKSDLLGSFLFLVECKRYIPPHKVGVEIVRSLYGVVQSEKATAGIIVTTSFFTSGAHEFQRSNKHQLHLRDYLGLQDWLQQVRGE